MQSIISRMRRKLEEGILFESSVRYVIEKQMKWLPQHPLYEKVYLAYIKRKTQRPLALTVNIETTNRCNAKCVFCPRDELTRTQGFMSDELFQELVEKIAQSTIPIHTLNMNGFGEPFLDAKLCDRINALKEQCPDIKVFLFSNGALLTPTIAEKVLDSKLDGMNISFNGSEKEYNKTMIHLDFHKTKGNILNFLKQRKERGQKKPIINLSCTYNDPLFDKEGFRREFKDLVDGIFIQSANKWGDEKNIDKHIYDFKQELKKNYPCRRLWTNLWIACNGDVYICCKDFNGEYVMDNIQGKSIQQVWHSPLFQNYRKLHLSGKMEAIRICKGCEDLKKCGTTWLTTVKKSGQY